MIKFILVQVFQTLPSAIGRLAHATQNRQGKTRLSKWYTPYDDDEKVRLRGEVHRLIAPRDQKYQSNFVEVSYDVQHHDPMATWFREAHTSRVHADDMP